MYRAVPCACGHAGCRDWHVDGVADVHGVKFTRTQAETVAETLNNLDETGEDEPEQIGCEVLGNGFARVSYRGHSHVIGVIEPLRESIAERLRKAGKGHERVPMNHLMFPMPICDNLRSLDTKRCDDIERHGVILRSNGIGTWTIVALDERLHRIDPRGEWVKDAVANPDKPMIEVFNEWLEELPLESTEVIRQSYRESQYWPGTPEQEYAQ